jgi:acetate kinase
MLVLTVNSGSTSVKLALYDAASSADPVRLAAERHSGRNLDAPQLLRALGAQLHSAPGMVAAPGVIAHRIVHGGTRFVRPTRIDRSVLAAIEELSPLAPLHNPAALRWVQAARDLWGEQTPQIAVFDTAYFASLPRVAAEYALAPRYGRDLGVRRYGFHGLAHESLWRRWCAWQPDLVRGGRLISLQLGGGCSLAAIDHGKPADTSMGFSPLEGLVMATRSGDVDAAIIPHLQRELGRTADEVVELLNRESGLAGLSGSAANPAQLAADPSPEAQFAIDLYCYRIRQYVGAYLAVLGGCDGIVFGGGVGEHVPAVRARALANLEWAGIVLDPALNDAARGGDARISDRSAKVAVHVAAADEEQVLLHAATALMNPGAAAS